MEAFETFDNGLRLPHPISAQQRLLALSALVGQLTDPPASRRHRRFRRLGRVTCRAKARFSHFLNAESARPDRFINCAMNGLFPLALEGLIEHYARSLHHRKIILHSNVLWMSSPKADLSDAKRTGLQSLAPGATIPASDLPLRADASERLSAVVERNVAFSAWVGHLQNAYFEQQSIPAWTLEEAGGDPLPAQAYRIRSRKSR